MKVKMFHFTGTEEAIEKQINDFIKDKKVLFVKQNESLLEDGLSLTITIWYEMENTVSKRRRGM